MPGRGAAAEHQQEISVILDLCLIFILFSCQITNRKSLAPGPRSTVPCSDAGRPHARPAAGGCEPDAIVAIVAAPGGGRVAGDERAIECRHLLYLGSSAK